MGRVRSQQKDTGVPGKFYFEQPVLTIVQGKKSTVAQVTSTPASGNCRLLSSHSLHGYTPPDNIVYEISQNPTHAEVTEYLRKMDIAGFGEGSVVCRRYQQPFRWRYPSQWGIIVITHRQAGHGYKYNPYTVKWFNEMDRVESAWAEDLVVIHANLHESVLKDLMETQGVEVESNE